MNNFFKAVGVIVLFAMSQVVFAQTGNVSVVQSEDVITEVLHNFAIRMSSGNIIQPERKITRSIKITISENGDRIYNFTNGRLLWKMDKSFGKYELQSGPVDEQARVHYLPINRKLEVGSEWVLNLSGSNRDCGAWRATWNAKAVAGPETRVLVDGSEVNLKTIKITQIYDTKTSDTGSCDPVLEGERQIVFSPDLNEIVFFQDSFVRPRSGQTYSTGYSITMQAITKAKK